MNPPANWYPDPTGRHGQRYWDGEAWTEHVFTDGVQSVDPLEEAATEADEAATDPGGHDAETAAAVPTEDAAAGTDPGADGARSGLFVDAGGAQTGATSALPTDGDTSRWTPQDDVRDGEPSEAVDEGEVDAGASTEAGVHDQAPTDDVWTDDEDGRVDVDSDPRGPADDELGADVAPEVEPQDVVASLDEVAAPGERPPPMASSDLSDAFVLAPETVSRLVRRQAPAEDDVADSSPAGDDHHAGAIDAPPPAVEAAPIADAPPPVADAPPPVVDAPPPSVPPSGAPTPTAGGPGGLGITGDLVGGAFAEREEAGSVALQNTRLLRCAVGADDGVIARQGTMVAYQGDVSFERQGAGGVGRALKRAATGEGLAMMRVEGSGDVFFADGAQHVFLLHLDGGPGLSVNGRNVLAFSSSLQWDIERVKGATLLAGGLFNTTLTGTGWVALVSDGEPVVLRTDEAATFVDVNALVAWSAGLSTRIVNTVSAKSLVGLGSGEAFQMAFDGAGVVIVQPSEGVAAATSGS